MRKKIPSQEGLLLILLCLKIRACICAYDMNTNIYDKKPAEILLSIAKVHVVAPLALQIVRTRAHEKHICTASTNW